ncbi:MAG: hypothetical protein ACRDKT_00975 [Actinomycetota bacterium]
MKIRRIIICSMLVLGGLVTSAAPAQAGLWCEQADEVDENVSGDGGVTAGQACRATLGIACTVVGKLNGGGGCLA